VEALPARRLQRVEDLDVRAITLTTQREHLAREPGDPSEVRAEREGLQRGLTQLMREHTELRDELAERELHSPGAWAGQAFGERSDEPRLRKEWEQEFAT
jgi:hypothetical protein